MTNTADVEALQEELELRLGKVLQDTGKGNRADARALLGHPNVAPLFAQLKEPDMSAYAAGESSGYADWEGALDDVLPETITASPTSVAEYIRTLHTVSLDVVSDERRRARDQHIVDRAIQELPDFGEIAYDGATPHHQQTDFLDAVVYHIDPAAWAANESGKVGRGKVKVDRGVEPLMKELWRRGVPTAFSCEGPMPSYADAVAFDLDAQTKVRLSHGYVMFERHLSHLQIVIEVLSRAYTRQDEAPFIETRLLWHLAPWDENTLSVYFHPHEFDFSRLAG